jgi:hypothetical protein
MGIPSIQDLLIACRADRQYFPGRVRQERGQQGFAVNYTATNFIRTFKNIQSAVYYKPMKQAVTLPSTKAADRHWIAYAQEGAERIIGGLCQCKGRCVWMHSFRSFTKDPLLPFDCIDIDHRLSVRPNSGHD